MFEKCTKTSSPSAWLMKPKPFSALKNLTVPVGIAVPLVSGWCIGLSGANVATGTDETTRTESNCERETPSTKAVTVAHRRKLRALVRREDPARTNVTKRSLLDQVALHRGRVRCVAVERALLGRVLADPLAALELHHHEAGRDLA